jgi:hypothetical protein
MSAAAYAPAASSALPQSHLDETFLRKIDSQNRARWPLGHSVRDAMRTTPPSESTYKKFAPLFEPHYQGAWKEPGFHLDCGVPPGVVRDLLIIYLNIAWASCGLHGSIYIMHGPGYNAKSSKALVKKWIDDNGGDSELECPKVTVELTLLLEDSMIGEYITERYVSRDELIEVDHRTVEFKCDREELEYDAEGKLLLEQPLFLAAYNPADVSATQQEHVTKKRKQSVLAARIKLNEVGKPVESSA